MEYGFVGTTKRFFFVETKNYKILFDANKGGTIVQYLLKPENINVLYREGIEMYWAVPKNNISQHLECVLQQHRDPHVTQEYSVEPIDLDWDRRHFEQEWGGRAELTYDILGDLLTVKVKSKCCWTQQPPKYYGETTTQWCFKEDLPYVYIEFEEDCLNMNPEGTERWFKRYIGSPPNIFTYYAKKLDDWALNNLNIIPNSEKYVHGDVYVRTPLEIQIEGDPPRHPAAKWLTLFNDKIGFAIIPLNHELWKGDEYPESSRCGLFHGWSMDELIYYCRRKEQKHRLDMIYYAFHTTPEKQYKILDETNFKGFVELINNGLV